MLDERSGAEGVGGQALLSILLLGCLLPEGGGEFEGGAPPAAHLPASPCVGPASDTSRRPVHGHDAPCHHARVVLLALHTLLSASLLPSSLASSRPWIDWADPIAHTSQKIPRATAERHILAYLAGFTRARGLPEELSIGSCENNCYRAIRSPGRHPYFLEKLDDEPCSSWTCNIIYGDFRRLESLVTFDVTVQAGGRWISDDLGITRCLARRHGCHLHRPPAVERQLVRPLAWESEAMWHLTWDRDGGQFVWVYSNRNHSRTRRLAAHRGR